MTKLSSQWWQIHGELCSKSHFSRQQWVTKAIASIPQDCATFPNNCDARECWVVFGHVWHKQCLFWTLSLCSGSELTQSWHKPQNLAFFLPQPQDDTAYLAFLHPNLLEADSVDNQVLLDLASNKGRTIEIWYRRISWGDCFTFLFIVSECNRQSSIPCYKSLFQAFFDLQMTEKLWRIWSLRPTPPMYFWLAHCAGGQGIAQCGPAWERHWTVVGAPMFFAGWTVEIKYTGRLSHHAMSARLPWLRHKKSPRFILFPW